MLDYKHREDDECNCVVVVVVVIVVAAAVVVVIASHRRGVGDDGRNGNKNWYWVEEGIDGRG